MRSDSSEPEVRAAGGVVWCLDGDETRSQDSGPTDPPLSDVEQLTILVVHRPRYDDWTLPKGKAEPGETTEECARREVFEETGIDVQPGRRVAGVRYRDQLGRLKEVVYFDMATTRPRELFEPNDEVDEVRWLSPREVREVLTHGHDVEVVDAFVAGCDPGSAAD